MNLHRALVVAALCLFFVCCSAGEASDFAAPDQTFARDGGAAESAPSSDAIQSGRIAASTKMSGAASVCAVGDQIVFSCPLAKGSKFVSMCATTSTTDAEPTFYYAFGHPGAPELRFPVSGHADNAAFSRTHLGFAGNTGGYAYSFANAGYKYIVYSISGAGASREGGVIVQPSTNAKAETKLTCRSKAITETRDASLIDVTSRLKKDPQIEASGLPESR